MEAFRLKRFAGSPYLNTSCFWTKMRSWLWLFKPSERDSKWLLAPETELWFSSRVSPVSFVQELRLDRPDLWIVKIKAKIGNDLVFVLFAAKRGKTKKKKKKTKGWTLDVVFLSDASNTLSSSLGPYFIHAEICMVVHLHLNLLTLLKSLEQIVHWIHSERKRNHSK